MICQESVGQDVMSQGPLHVIALPFSRIDTVTDRVFERISIQDDSEHRLFIYHTEKLVGLWVRLCLNEGYCLTNLTATRRHNRVFLDFSVKVSTP